MNEFPLGERDGARLPTSRHASAESAQGVRSAGSALKRLASDAGLRQLTRYVTVGGASALTEVLLFYIYLTWLALPLMAANVAAVCSVTFLGFFAQKHFTFRARGRMTFQAMLYVLQLGINFVLNNALVFLFAHVGQLRPIIAKVLQLGLCFLFNFTFSKFVFGRATAERGNRVR
jgi:putative flippase GtrA